MGAESIFGQVVTVKAFEDNSYVKLEEDGENRVLVVDGGGVEDVL